MSVVLCVCIMLCQIVSCVYICVMHVNAYIVNQAYITVHYQYSMQCTREQKAIESRKYIIYIIIYHNFSKCKY